MGHIEGSSKKKKPLSYKVKNIEILYKSIITYLKC